MTAIHKRCYYAMRNEFRLMSKVFATFLPPVYPYSVYGADQMVKIDNPIKELRLQVKPANLQDVGKNFARLSTKTLEELGINPGDVLEIFGKEENRTTVVVWVAPDDEMKDVIRIDGTVRREASILSTLWMCSKSVR